MTRPGTLVVLALAGASLGGCDAAGTRVALNERIFNLPSRESAGKGCTTFELAGRSIFDPGGPNAGAGGNVGGLVISQRQLNDAVLIQVTEGNRVVDQRRYDEAFFRSGRIDELTVQGARGEQKLLRYWGAVATDGPPPCAPFEDDGDRPR